MKVTDLIQEFKDKKIQNTKTEVDKVGKYLRKTLEIKTYIPFRTKREIAEIVVAQNIKEINGVKKNDQINQYISFVVAMLKAHTNIEFSEDPVADYDLLSESGLLPQIVAEFQESYNECDIVLKMAISMELEDNNINLIVGRLLNNLAESLKNKLDSFNFSDLLGSDIKKEDVAKILSFLDKNK